MVENKKIVILLLKNKKSWCVKIDQVSDVEECRGGCIVTLKNGNSRFVAQDITRVLPALNLKR